MPINFISANPRPSDLEESNDCAVRATAIASGLPYDKVRDLYAKYGRKPKHGVVVATIRCVLRDICKDATYISYANYKTRYRPTLNQFIKDRPNGNWIICRLGHAFAVKDGVVYDAHSSQAGARCKVLFAFKLND